MATPAAPATKEKRTLPITIFAKMRNEVTNREDARGTPTGRQNDSAYQQKYMNHKILLAIT
jgi:hypothetical protein